MVDVDEDTFGELVEAALDSIPDQLRRRMRNVVVVVEDIGPSPNLLGLYQGVPLTSRTTTYAGVLPDRITIYRLPILRHCRSVEDVVQQVRVTVVFDGQYIYELSEINNWSGEFGIRKVLPATHQHWAYAFYLQDADTNFWEFEVWDDGIDPVARALAHDSTKGAM